MTENERRDPDDSNEPALHEGGWLRSGSDPERKEIDPIIAEMERKIRHSIQGHEEDPPGYTADHAAEADLPVSAREGRPVYRDWNRPAWDLPKDHPRHQPERIWGDETRGVDFYRRGRRSRVYGRYLRRIVFWVCVAALTLAFVVLVLRHSPYRRVQTEKGYTFERQPMPDLPPYIEPVSPRVNQVVLRQATKFETFALIYPKQMEVQSIERELKREQERREADGDYPLSRSEQIDWIDRMLLKQIFVVTREQVDGALKEVQDSLKRAGRPPFSADERQEQRNLILEGLIDTVALGLEGLKTFADASREVRAYYGHVRDRFSGEASFTRWVKSVYGSEEAFRRWAEVKFAAEKYRADTESRAAEVEEEKIRSYYQEDIIFYEEPEKATVAQIFIRVRADATESERRAKEGLIRQIHEKLRLGAGFGAMAAKHSEDGNASREGILEAMERDEPAPELGSVIFNLKPNEISPVVRTGRGFHILKLVNRNPQRTRAYDEARGEILSRLSREQLRNFMPSHIAELRRNLEIRKR